MAAGSEEDCCLTLQALLWIQQAHFLAKNIVEKLGIFALSVQFTVGPGIR